MYYYINDACFELAKISFFTRSKFVTDEDTTVVEGEIKQPRTIYTITIVFTNTATPLILSYFDEEERNNDFNSIREAVHGYGRI